MNNEKNLLRNNRGTIYDSPKMDIVKITMQDVICVSYDDFFGGILNSLAGWSKEV